MLRGFKSTNPDTSVCLIFVPNNPRKRKTFLILLEIQIYATPLGYRPQYAGTRADGLLQPPHICPDYSAVNEPAVTRLLQDHLTVQINLPAAQATASNTGILYVLSLAVPNITHQFWITPRDTLLAFTQDFQKLGYNAINFDRSLPKRRGYISIQGSWSQTRFKQYSQRRLHPQLCPSPWCPQFWSIQPRIFTVKRSLWYNGSTYWDDDRAATSKSCDDGTTPTPIVSAIFCYYTCDSDQKNSDPPLSQMVWDARDETTLIWTSWDLQVWGILCMCPRLNSNDNRNQTPQYCK